MVYSAIDLPQGATFDAVTKAFNWTPNYAQSGSYNVTFTVDDSKGGTASETITITVNNVNRPPVIESIHNYTVFEGKPLSFSIKTSDPDSEDEILISLSGIPHGATFPNSVFNWTPDYNQSGIYLLTLTVSD